MMPCDARESPDFAEKVPLRIHDLRYPAHREAPNQSLPRNTMVQRFFRRWRRALAFASMITLPFAVTATTFAFLNSIG